MTLWSVFTALCATLTFVPLALFGFYGTMQKRRLKDKVRNKVVLITGASSGLGEALAHVFYEAGCKVVLAARREEELLRVKQDLLTTHTTEVTHPPVVLPLDLSDLNALPGKVANVLKIFGHVDILVNNGGISYRGDVLSTSIDVDIKLMLVNYFGQVAMTKAVLPSMVERKRGHVVAVGSVQGKISIPHRSAYAAAKHALQAFCDALRAEIAPYNIKVTLINPGYVQTSLSLNAITGDGQRYGVMDKTTASGASAARVAEEILYAVAAEKKEYTTCPILPRIAILLRMLYPDLYFWTMQERAKTH